MENIAGNGLENARKMYGVDPDEEDKIREHNETIQSQLDVMERVMADIVEKKAKLQSQMI